MLNIGAGEMVLIAVVALLVLGPERLPQLARGLGKAVRAFRRQTEEVRTVVEREFYRMDEDVQAPLPPKLPERERPVARGGPALPTTTPGAPIAVPDPGGSDAQNVLAGPLDPSFAATQRLPVLAPAELGHLTAGTSPSSSAEAGRSADEKVKAG